jgi:ACR3 family arsenite efflux pump ArsB
MEINDKLIGASVPILIALIRMFYQMRLDIDAAHQKIREMKKK